MIIKVVGFIIAVESRHLRDHTVQYDNRLVVDGTYSFESHKIELFPAYVPRTIQLETTAEASKIPLKNFRNLQVKIGFIDHFQVLGKHRRRNAQTRFYCNSGCSSHRKFNYEVSDSYRPDGQPDEAISMIQYGTGSCILEYGRDNVQVGDVTIQNQRIGLTLEESIQPFSRVPLDGIFGLGYAKPGSTWYEASPIQNMIRQNLLDKPIISFDLDSITKSHMYLGNFPEQSVDGQNGWSWFSLTSMKHWQIPLKALTLNGNVIPGICSTPEVDTHIVEDVNYSNSEANKRSWLPVSDDDVIDVEGLSVHKPLDKYCSAAIDTGSSLVTLPRKDFFHLISELTLSSPLLPCHGSLSDTRIGFVLEDVDGQAREYSISSDNFMLPLMTSAGDEPSSEENSEELCAFGVMPMTIPDNEPLAVLGLVFLEAHFVAFDYGRLSIPSISYSGRARSRRAKS